MAATSISSGGAPKRVLVFGDSNSFRPVGGDTCWPALLMDKDPIHLDVFNESYDGRTTKYDTGERNGLGIIGSKLACYSSLDYVIVMLGTNDAKSQYGPPRVTDIADGMGQILDLIKRQGNGVEPILVTPPPMGSVTSGDLAGAQLRVASVVAEYRLLAMKRDIRLVDVYRLLDCRIDLESDSIHLNTTGRRKVADAVWSNSQDVTSPAQVTGFFGILDGPHFNLNWNTSGADVFYYRIYENGKVIGKTAGTHFEVAEPVIGKRFGIQAVDFSQNTGPVSPAVVYG
jgi:lysophospholipase L1-like esterase